ncbi:MAG: hypothetical protein RL545_645 [Actinomycetota bacterium]|jgi:heme-degrading monooxygenase HmoA
MVLEHALLNIKVGLNDEFEKALISALPILRNFPGNISARVLKSVEKENQFLLLAEWDSVSSHEDGFRKSEEYQEWKKLLHKFYEPFPEVTHFT